MFIDYLDHLFLKIFNFHISLLFYHHLSIVINNKDSASRLSGFKRWLHHIHIVSFIWPLYASIFSCVKRQQHLPHMVVKVFISEYA